MGIVGGQEAPNNDELVRIAQLLADPDKLAAEYSQLQEARAEAERVINLVGTANEIMAVKKEVYAAQQAATAALAAAQAEAQEILDVAQAEAARRIEDANTAAAKIVEGAETLKAAALTVREEAVQEREAAKAEKVKAMQESQEAARIDQIAKEAIAKSEAAYQECVALRAKLEQAQKSIIDALT